MKSDDVYRKPDEAEVDPELYEKALALLRIEAMRLPIHYTNNHYGWSVGRIEFDSGAFDYRVHHGSEKWLEASDPYQDLIYVVNLAYTPWYRNKKKTWDKASREAIDFNLIDPSDAEDCPHVTIDNEDREELPSLAALFDAITDGQVSIGVPDGKITWVFRDNTLTNAGSSKAIRHADFFGGLDQLKNWRDGEYQRNKDKAREKAFELGILTQPPVALAKVTARKAIASKRGRLIGGLTALLALVCWIFNALLPPIETVIEESNIHIHMQAQETARQVQLLADIQSEAQEQAQALQRRLWSAYENGRRFERRQTVRNRK